MGMYTCIYIYIYAYVVRWYKLLEEGGGGKSFRDLLMAIKFLPLLSSDVSHFRDIYSSTVSFLTLFTPIRAFLLVNFTIHAYSKRLCKEFAHYCLYIDFKEKKLVDLRLPHIAQSHSQTGRMQKSWRIEIKLKEKEMRRIHFAFSLKTFPLC